MTEHRLLLGFLLMLGPWLCGMKGIDLNFVELRIDKISQARTWSEILEMERLMASLELLANRCQLVLEEGLSPVPCYPLSQKIFQAGLISEEAHRRNLRQLDQKCLAVQIPHLRKIEREALENPKKISSVCYESLQKRQALAIYKSGG